MGLLDRWAKKKTEEQLAGEGMSTNTATSEEKTAASPKAKKNDAVKKGEKKVRKEKTAATDSVGAMTVKGTMYQAIIAPLLSEKTMRHEQQGTYSFLVKRDASKQQISLAVKELYGVMPERVMTMNIQGKHVRFGRSMGRRSDYKKALVKLPKGSTIAVHEGV